ncbi:MAG: PilN domain-containing protein [Pseudomonadota bacterium]
MIQQQINLYQPMFRKQVVQFSAMTMLQITVLFLVLFSGIYAYQFYQLKPYQAQLENIDKELTQLSQQVTVVENQFKKKDKNKLLESEIKKLESQLAQKEKISNVLGKRFFGNAQGFSGYLEAFARQHVEGTWLTTINLQAGGSLLNINGKTLSSELVPGYIQKLSNEERLKGTTFNMMEIARVMTEEGDSEINFQIRTN